MRHAEKEMGLCRVHCCSKGIVLVTCHFAVTKYPDKNMLRDRGLILVYSPMIQYIKGKSWYQGLQAVDHFASTVRKHE